MIKNIIEFAELADYSLVDKLNPDPESTEDGIDHESREVFSGHYVPVAPTPIENPLYVIHSKILFQELGISDELVNDKIFKEVFSANLLNVPKPMKKFGWATGYALTIYGTEYNSQCPFQTGNGYGDGRAISVFEGVFCGKRWEMQLKGAGPTPYCRGGDGRAVLRSSVREFLAQEYMHALGVSTSRSLCLFTSNSETVRRPWYSNGSHSFNPDIMLDNPVAISTRVAPSFLRVGQIELFARRYRKNNNGKNYEELKLIVNHLIEREYKEEITSNFSFEEQVVLLAKSFRNRLISLVCHWMRVGYCQGNFNSDNCAAGGFTLDYGPFGFCEVFDPAYQPWTGGGRHFSFFNQLKAAQLNYEKFCNAIGELLAKDSAEYEALKNVLGEFENIAEEEFKKVWCLKLGISNFDNELFQSLMNLMIETKVDYTIFFRELSNIPNAIEALKKSFYTKPSENLEKKWMNWLLSWREIVFADNDDISKLSTNLKSVNPKYAWREWLIVPAYEKAGLGDYSLIEELQEILTNPYAEQAVEVESKYYRLKPSEYNVCGGVSHYSCSS